MNSDPIDNFRAFLATNPNASTDRNTLAAAVATLFQGFQKWKFEGIEHSTGTNETQFLGVSRRVADYLLEDQVKPVAKLESVDGDGDYVTDLVFVIDEVLFHACFCAPSHSDDQDCQLDVKYERIESVVARRLRVNQMIEEVNDQVANRITSLLPTSLPIQAMAKALIHKLGPILGREFANNVVAAQDRAEAILT